MHPASQDISHGYPCANPDISCSLPEDTSSQSGYIPGLSLYQLNPDISCSFARGYIQSVRIYPGVIPVPILIYPAVLLRIHPLSLSQDISKSYSSPTLIKIYLVVLPDTSGTGFLVYFHCRIYSSVVGWFHIRQTECQKKANFAFRLGRCSGSMT
jgi:hypothetical protein